MTGAPRRRQGERHAETPRVRRRPRGARSRSPAAAEPFRMIVTDMEVPLVPNSVMELAEQEGYFDRAGVDVEFVRVQQTPLAMAALRAGEGEMANVALEALLQATAAGRDRPPRRHVAEQVAALPHRRPRRHRRGRRPRRQALRHRPDRQRRPPALDEGARGRRRRPREARARRPRPAAGSAPRRSLAGQIDATTMASAPSPPSTTTPRSAVLVGVDAYYRAAPILSKLNVVRTDTLADRGADVEAVIEAITLASRDFAAAPRPLGRRDAQGAARRAGGRPRAPRRGLRRHLEHRRRHHPPRARGGAGLAARGRGLRRHRAGARSTPGPTSRRSSTCWRRSAPPSRRRADPLSRR